MNGRTKLTIGISAVLVAMQAAAAQITFYEGEDFHGRVFTTDKAVTDLANHGFNDRASSVVVEDGKWEVCEDVRFGGRCTLLRRGSYESLQQMGINNRISSVRRADSKRRYENQASEPLPEPSYEYRRRPDERLFEAPVTSVHAVVGAPEQRCWVEREQVTEPGRRAPNVGGAIAGAIIGGIIGHQIGDGRGNDLATAGGAVAGGALGAHVGTGNDSSTTHDRDVRRCESTASTTPEYWDVTYSYGGVEHRVQMTAPPGSTVPVNREGEPRA